MGLVCPLVVLLLHCQSILWVKVRSPDGLNVTPLIMKSLIDVIASQDHTIKSATSAYVDDILINANLVPALRIQQHFLNYILVSKDPVRLRDKPEYLTCKSGKRMALSDGKRKSISVNPWWINPSTRIFSLRETCGSLPCMWVAQSGSCIYQAPGNCSIKELGW